MEFTKDINFSGNLKEKQTVKITYSGELFKNNSDAVTIVYGFGDNWDYTTEQEMNKTEAGFTADVEIKENFDKFNFCFRNSNYVWDNNGNTNYISNIEPISLEELLEPKEEIDENLIIELLDSLLNENINYVKEDSEENNKQQILDDILTENDTEETSYVWSENFDMDALIENILNPVINCATVEDESNDELFDEITKEYFTEELTSNTAEYFSESTIHDNYIEPVEAQEPSLLENVNIDTKDLIETSSEDKFLVSPRQLSRFYLIKKKIKLAFYKLFVGLPKLLSGEYGKSRD